MSESLIKRVKELNKAREDKLEYSVDKQVVLIRAGLIYKDDLLKLITEFKDNFIFIAATKDVRLELCYEFGGR